MSHGLVTDAPVARESFLARRNVPAHIVGGVTAEGVAVARLLAELGFPSITLHDSRERGELRKAFRTTHGAYSRQEQDDIFEELEPLLDHARLGDAYLSGIETGATVVLGQGWYLDEGNRAAIVAAVPSDAFLTSMTALYFAFAPGAVAAITGTNGKSTTLALTDHLLEAGAVPHATAGNERGQRQFLPWIGSLAPEVISLLEVSNRQLMQLGAAPRVAAITSLTPDHLEEHGGLGGYMATKTRLFAPQGAGDIAIANADDAAALEVALRSGGTLVRCGIGHHSAPSVCWVDEELVATDVPLAAGGSAGPSTVVATRSDVPIPGTHNLRNVAVSVALALACGTPPKSIAAGLRAFAGTPLRLESLGPVAAGIEIWSDLKSTTPQATMAAVEALHDRAPVLVLGGTDKGLDYGPLARVLAEQSVPAVAVPGSATDVLERELASLGMSLHRVETLEDALRWAIGAGQLEHAVVVSPAAAGFWTTQLQGKPSLRALTKALREEISRERDVEEARP